MSEKTTPWAHFTAEQDPPSVKDWLDEQERQGAKLDRGAIEARLARLQRSRLDASPLYLQALTVIGSIITGALLIYLLFLLELLNSSEFSMIFNGIALIGLSAFIVSIELKNKDLRRDFQTQLCLTLLQAGKLLLVAGIGIFAHDQLNWEPGWIISVALAFLTGLGFTLFPFPFERFITTLAFLASLWVNLMLDLSGISFQLAFSSLLLLHLIGIGICLHLPDFQYRLPGLLDGLLLSLCFGVGIVAMEAELVGAGLIALPWGGHLGQLANVILLGGLFTLIFWVSSPFNGSKKVILAALAGTLIPALISEPGILLALGLMILGYGTHRPHQSILGLLFGIFFLSRYYYFLDMSLLTKSLVLVLSGLVLLAGAGLIVWSGWHRANERSA